MVEIGSQKMQNAALTNRRSLGSSQCPSGQFPKVSIGITVDKCSKTESGVRKDLIAALPAERRMFSCQGAEETTRTGIAETFERSRSDNVENHKASAWFSARSERYACVDKPTAETVKFFINSSSALQSENGVHTKFNTIAYGKRKEKGGNVERLEEVAFATMQETRLMDKGNVREEPEETAKFNEKRLNTITYGKRREKGGDVERTEEVSKKQLVGEENGKEPEKMAKCNNEDLKMKLWEILGTAPSENKHTPNSLNTAEYKESLNINQSGENQEGEVARMKLNSPDHEQKKERTINQSREYKKGKATRGKLNSRELKEHKENFSIKNSREFQKGKAVREKQNSDTIETDSESPNQVMRRPVTRSLTRKRYSPEKVQKLQGNVSNGKKPLSSSSSDFKFKLEKENTFSFDELEGKAGSLCHTSSVHSNRSKEKINKQNKAKVEPRRIHFPRSTGEKILHNNDREKTSHSPDKASPQSKERRNSSVPHQHKKQFVQTVDGTPNDSHRLQGARQLNFDSPLWTYNRETCENTDSPLLKMKKHSWGYENSAPESKNTFLCDDVACQLMGKKTDQLADFHTPAFAEDKSPSSSNMPHNEVLSSPVAAGRSKSFQNNYSSKDLDISAPGFCQLDADSEASDDTRDIHKLRDMESPFMKDGELEKQQLSLSLIEEQDTESEADDITSQGFGLTNKWFPQKSPEKSPISLYHTKRVRSLNNVKLSKVNLSSPSPTSTPRMEETVVSLEDLEQYPEGSLARCVAQLAMVLERFKMRMKLQTSRRSSEILSAAADKIHHQLQDVESQMLTDVGRFNHIGKSKRKRLESRFQEQEERLKLIHDKFKEEVKQHLLDCTSILEECEAYNMELKGTADEQKASHRKLLLQVEEAMEDQIHDAETAIAAIHKDARRKMIGLKRVLKEWMN